MPYVSRLLYFIINQSLSPKYYLQLTTEISGTNELNNVKPSSFELMAHQILHNSWLLMRLTSYKPGHLIITKANDLVE